MSMSLLKTLNNISDDYPRLKLIDLKMLCSINSNPDCTLETYEALTKVKPGSRAHYSLELLEKYKLIIRKRFAFANRYDETRITKKGKELILDLLG